MNEKENLIRHYNTLLTDELDEIKNNGTLTDVALVAIDEVLEQRRITESDKKQQKHVKDTSFKTKVLPIILLIIFLISYRMIPRQIKEHFKPTPPPPASYQQ